MKVQVIYLSATAFAALVLSFFPRWTVDDAFITARYARNLANYGEFVWNVGEPPVEGYTGVLLPLIEAASIRVGGDPVITAKAAGLCGLFLAAVLTAACLRRVGCREPIPVMGWTAVLTAPFFFTHATSGLETMLFIAALCGALWSFLRAVGGGRHVVSDECVFAGVLLVAGMIRPEGALLGPIFGGALLWARRQRNAPERGATAIRLLCIYVIPAAAYFLWRANYYSSLLPNAFYAKSYDGLINRTAMRSLGEFGLASLAIPLSAALGIGILHFKFRIPDTIRTLGAEPEPVTARWCAVVATSLYLLLVNLQYLRSQMIMNYSFRFFAPSYPLVLILIGAGAKEFFGNGFDFRHVRPAAYRIALVAFTALAGLQLFVNFRGLRREFDKARVYAQFLEDEHVEAARFLVGVVPRGERLSVHIDAGVIPYLTGLSTVDFGRLNDAYLARKANSQRDAVEYFFERNPAAAVFTTRDWHRIDYTSESEAITADPRFTRYRLVKRFRTTRSTIPYYQFIYLRDDITKSSARG